MSARELHLLWADAIEALERYNGVGTTPLHLAAYGHPNARAIVAQELAEASGCNRGDGPCSNEGGSCAPGKAGPCPASSIERNRLRDRLTALRNALETGQADVRLPLTPERPGSDLGSRVRGQSGASAETDASGTTPGLLCGCGNVIAHERLMATLEEREACARIAEAEHRPTRNNGPNDRIRIAAAIRARGQQ